MQQFFLALDLKNDDKLIAAYKAYHQQVWPEIISSIKAAGIQQMEIYNTGNRLLMVITATDDFSFDKKAIADAANIKVQEWETLMATFQQALPWAPAGEKWVLLEKIFKLDN
ncbi:MAG: hypothetical protein RL172_886 [Bacteroidota bacterium]|jgi:L-rhamnose mutarotase